MCVTLVMIIIICALVIAYYIRTRRNDTINKESGLQSATVKSISMENNDKQDDDQINIESIEAKIIVGGKNDDHNHNSGRCTIVNTIQVTKRKIMMMTMKVKPVIQCICTLFQVSKKTVFGKNFQFPQESVHGNSNSEKQPTDKVSL